LIPRIAPRWTDHNVHDPGITFVELFAWLTEMQLYRLNRVSDQTREVFARLAGVKRKPLTPSQANIHVEGVPSAGAFLPAGTQLVPLEGDEIIFETDADLLITRSQIRKVIVDDCSGPVDQTAANQQFGITFRPFGQSARKDAELRLGFDAFYDDEDDIRLTADVVVDDLVGGCGSLNPSAIEEGREVAPILPVELAWEYLGVLGWASLTPRSDETFAFSRSGAVTLPVPVDAKLERDLFWIRVRIARGYYDNEPRLLQIAVNVLPCVQRNTVRDQELLPVTVSDGRPDQSFTLQLKEGDALLVPEPDAPATITSSKIAGWSHLTNELERAHPALAASLAQSRSSWRQTEYRQINALNRELPVSGLTSESQPVLAPLLGRVPVVVTVDGEAWQMVSSFDDSSPESKHYMLDLKSGSISFGNGLNGLSPARDQQICALWYQVSAGALGNVGKNLNWKFRGSGITGVSLTNPAAASGGSDLEPLDDLELRVQASLYRPERGVTLADIENLALATPAVYVGRSKAIPNCPTPEAITVVVVPKIRPGRKGPPTPPSDAFLNAVRNYLEEHRILCDNLRVIGPAYIEVRISANLRVGRGASPVAVAERARQSLNRFLAGDLQPTDGSAEFADDPLRNDSLASPCSTRWPFGRFVYPSEVYAILDDVPGVDYASNVVLRGSRDGSPVQPDQSGAISVPTTGLVYAGSHELVAESEPRRN
jgi:hypothetical protein